MILFGETNVGCNQLARVAVGLEFDETMGCVFSWSFSNFEIKNKNKTITTQIWNGPGQEKYLSMTKLFLRGSEIVLFVYDTTNKRSFDALYYRIQLINEILCNKYLGAIVGNKVDLYMYEQVKESEGRELAKKHNFKFYLSSAKCNPKGFQNFIKELISERLKNKN